MIVHALLLAPVLTWQDPDLEGVRAAETRRVEVIAEVAPSVCSVMRMDSPGGGSGVIIDPMGFVLTNFHVVGKPDKEYEPKVPDQVVEDWKKANPAASDKELEAFEEEWRRENLPTGARFYKPMKVGLPDGRLYRAHVLGIDPGSDLAILLLEERVDGDQWPYSVLGDSDELLVGETVFAMGNPFLLATDFTPTVTFGIVSGTHRYQEGAGQRMLVYPDCIQVDAPVNPGNSGGPLFNERGEVVGINGRISIGDRGRVNVGVGFAIASNQIRNFIGDMMAGRHAEHGTLDMSAWYMTAPNEESGRRGVFVQQVFRDSVVADVGVRLGDEITHFNGEPVRTANQLATRVGVMPAHAWVSLGYRPQNPGPGYGAERTVYLQLAELDTGSSIDEAADTTRLASPAHRRLATVSLSRNVGREGTSERGARVEYVASDGGRVVLQRRGKELRIDRDGVALVRSSDGSGFAIRDGAVADLTAEESALLDREYSTNPFIWSGADRRAQMQSALLEGGVHVHGRPAYRFALPGDGEREIWYYDDGTAAGYRLRDPVQRVLVERRVCHPDETPVGGTLRVVRDGALDPDWNIGGPVYEMPEEGLFRRPGK